MAAGLLHAFLNSGAKGAAVNGMRASLPKAKAVLWPDQPGEPRAPKASRARGFGTTARRPAGGAAGAGLITAVKQLAPDDFLAESASQNEATYAELLLSVLEDGEVTSSEIGALDDLAESLNLSDSEVGAIKGRLLLWTARQAWRDDKISNVEKSELKELAEMMTLPASDAKKALDEVEMARTQRLNRKTKPLPSDWSLGEPLRVADRVVFTGCDPDDRAHMEEKAARAGLKVAGSVTTKTKLLVTDYTVNGVKDNAAIELGIRRVGPDDFKVLLDFIQPMENPGK
jgi:DNA polymerase-3 subunit epsilon